ncbi:MAG TPA: Ig domain-containing protein, partial [Myxococcota bacterium]|nr:Ig domain-containing protein [Myxococcota bacterium]
MKRASAAAIALLCAACGSSSDAPQAPAGPSNPARAAAAAGQENAPPEIESAEITPNPAGSADALSLEVRARDPEQDRLRTTIEWYRNGELAGDLHETIVEPGSFARGDRVYAIVYVADATHEVSRQTQTIVIGNSAPRVKGVSLSPAKATSADFIEAQPDVQDSDGDSIEMSYRWRRNGELIPAATSSRLPPGTLHRGDKVYVEASASDGSDSSPWVPSPVVEVVNAPPVISSVPSYQLGQNAFYSYDIAAKDPDNDEPLRYELVQGPKGMVVDEVSGKLSWQVPQEARGDNPIQIAVSDAYGGRVTQSWSLSVDWNQLQPPASPAATGEGRKAKAKTQSEAEDNGGLDEETPAKK